MSAPDPEPTVRAALEAGRRVFGRFDLTRRLGSGGMGEVWLARDQSLAIEVCLKFLPEHVRWSPGARAAHKAEALRARALAHPHIVRVHDFVEDASFAAIVMEHVEGRTLAAERVARRHGVLTPVEIVAWLPQLAAAVDYLHHTAHVAHGDVKPSNVLLRGDGTLKLADFGVAREFPPDGKLSRPATSTVGGTLPYLSPQRVLGTATTPADDIYALGVLLYELLTGKPPFIEGDVTAQIELLSPEPIAARRRRFAVHDPADVPANWETVVQACLAKRAADRPPSAGIVAAQLIAATGSPRPRRRLLVATGVAALLTTASALWWAHARNTASGLHLPAPHVTTEFAEDFDSGLAGWVRWGDPPPRVLQSFQGRDWVFDNNGDGIHTSGATSVAVISAPQGFELRSEVRLDVSNPTGCHLDAQIGLTADPASWMNSLGSEGDSGEGLKFGITYAGEMCWGSQPEQWRHAFFLGWFLGEDGTRIFPLDDVPPESRVADRFLNRWTTLRIVVEADRQVRFYADDTLVCAPPQRVHPSLLAGQRVVVNGRSAGIAGKAYHDDVVLRAPAGATLEVTTMPRADTAHTSRLPWNDAMWTQRTIGGATTISWPTDSDELLLTAPDGGMLGVRTQQVWRNFAVAEIDVQPFLNSGGTAADMLTVFVEQHTAEGWRRWAAELRGSEIWLVERDPTGRDTVVSRTGTYAPGSWTTLVFTRNTDNAMELVGSRLHPKLFATRAPAAADEWTLGFEIASSTDGAAVRPPRVSAASR